ncbi:hypothetical protein OS493_038057 [Desmophyllum pertusum]|uniref:Uncharacterized protein n=1 Tax=Desmophyllum pertusum TaxID=174260 RepID=A0A9W9YU94_9CNID|nr:hypothetical protein OS493_038057 [Desmophyllum pertusum]
MKKIIHEILQRFGKEQTTSDDSWANDIDLTVAEMQSKEGIRLCPVCITSMPKAKRKCINQECRVSLKIAKKQANGTAVLGPASIAPVRSFHHRMHEPSLLGENSAFVYSK